jgi:uncharacterized HAD superfamily protein
MSQKIALDLDDVLIQTFRSPVHLFHNREYGTAYAAEDMLSYNLAELWGCGPKIALERMYDYHFSPEHDESEPMLGAADAVAFLRGKFDLYIITSRSECFMQKTLSIIHPFFPLSSFKDIIFTNQYHGTSRGSKADVCKKLRIGTMVEDCIENAYEIASEGTRVLLLDAPWNRKPITHPIIPVQTWDAVLKELLVPDMVCENCFKMSPVLKKISSPQAHSKFFCVPCAEAL